MDALGRRSFLQLSGGLGLAAVAGSTLTACGSGDTGSVANTGTELAAWPSYIPFVGPAADLPSDGKGVQNAYINYPTDIVKSVADVPGDGSEVTAIMITYSPPPDGVDSSPRWQAVNKALGITLKVTVVPDAQFAEKMATVMASGNLPDIIMLGAGYTLPREEQFVASECADLSALISGDAIKDYPNLANIPGYAWNAMGRIGGKIYGIPIERPLPGNSLLVNRTQLDKVGAPATWSKDEFTAAMGKLTGKRAWGIGIAREALGGSGLAYHAGSMGAPNGWKLDGDTFVSTFGTDEYKEALGFTADLWKKGYYYPDSATTSQVDLETLLFNETVSSITDGLRHLLRRRADGQGCLLGGLRASVRLGFDALAGNRDLRLHGLQEGQRRSSEDACCACATTWRRPFGTEEYELNAFGIEGKDFTRSGDSLTLSETGNPLPAPVPLHRRSARSHLHPRLRRCDQAAARLGDRVDPPERARSVQRTALGDEDGIRCQTEHHAQ